MATNSVNSRIVFPSAFAEDTSRRNTLAACGVYTAGTNCRSCAGSRTGISVPTHTAKPIRGCRTNWRSPALRIPASAIQATSPPRRSGLSRAPPACPLTRRCCPRLPPGSTAAGLCQCPSSRRSFRLPALFRSPASALSSPDCLLLRPLPGSPLSRQRPTAAGSGNSSRSALCRRIRAFRSKTVNRSRSRLRRLSRRSLWPPASAVQLACQPSNFVPSNGESSS